MLAILSLDGPSYGLFPSSMTSRPSHFAPNAALYRIYVLARPSTVESLSASCLCRTLKYKTRLARAARYRIIANDKKCPFAHVRRQS